MQHLGENDVLLKGYVCDAGAGGATVSFGGVSEQLSVIAGSDGAFNAHIHLSGPGLIDMTAVTASPSPVAHRQIAYQIDGPRITELWLEKQDGHWVLKGHVEDSDPTSIELHVTGSSNGQVQVPPIKVNENGDFSAVLDGDLPPDGWITLVAVNALGEQSPEVTAYVPH
jgi:hypothetical protein